MSNKCTVTTGITKSNSRLNFLLLRVLGFTGPIFLIYIVFSAYSENGDKLCVIQWHDERNVSYLHVFCVYLLYNSSSQKYRISFPVNDLRHSRIIYRVLIEVPYY